jgi:hypothetical protein
MNGSQIRLSLVLLSVDGGSSLHKALLNLFWDRLAHAVEVFLVVPAGQRLQIPVPEGFESFRLIGAEDMSSIKPRRVAYRHNY